MKLLYKELMLAAHPTSIVFAFLGCLRGCAGLSLYCDLHVRLLSSLYYIPLRQGDGMTLGIPPFSLLPSGRA